MSTSTNNFMIGLLSRLSSPPSPAVRRSAASLRRNSAGASWRTRCSRSTLVSAAERASASVGGLLSASHSHCAQFLRVLDSTRASRTRSRRQSLASPPSFKHIRSPRLSSSLLHSFLADSDIVMSFGTPVDIMVFGLIVLLLLVCAAAAYVVYNGWTTWGYTQVDMDEEVSDEKQNSLPRFADQSHHQLSFLSLFPYSTSSPSPSRSRSPSIPIPTIIITSPSGSSHTLTSLPSTPAKVPRLRPQPPAIPDPTKLSWVPWVPKSRPSCQSRSTSPTPPRTQCQVGTANRVRTRPAGRMGRARSDSFYGGRPIIATGPIPNRRPRFEGGVTVDIGSAVVVAAAATEIKMGCEVSVSGLPTPPASPDAASGSREFEFHVSEVTDASVRDAQVEVEEKVPGSFEVCLPASQQQKVSVSLPTPPPTPPFEAGDILPAKERRERKPLSIVIPPSVNAVSGRSERRVRGKENAVERC